jgi:hypothetical protein
MNPDQVFELRVYQRDGWRCVTCRSTVELRVCRRGRDTADPGSYGTYCPRCAPHTHG